MLIKPHKSWLLYRTYQDTKNCIMTLVISRKDCEKILKNRFQWYNGKLEISHVEVVPLLEKSTGFFGLHSQLKIEVYLEECVIQERCPQTVMLFVKAMPQVAIHQKYIDEIGAFKKEVNSFKILLPSMLELSREYGKCWAPECYLAKPNLLVFENLIESGFSNCKDSLFDRDHLLAAAECLGYFHSCSLIFERRAVQVNEEFSMLGTFENCLFESLYVEDEKNIRHKWFHSGIDIIIQMARLMNKYNEEQIAEVKARFPLLLDGIKRNFRPDSTKTNVVCHGDLWANNLMFKYDRNTPVDCRLVDFQLVRYAPNTLDLTCMLHLCADRDTRETNLHGVLYRYISSFNSQLVLSGFGDSAMDLSRVRKEYQGFRLSALVEACLYEMVTGLDEERSAELLASPVDTEELFYGDRARLVLPAFGEDARYRGRMAELIEELLDTYVLP